MSKNTLSGIQQIGVSAQCQGSLEMVPGTIWYGYQCLEDTAVATLMLHTYRREDV